MNEEDVVDVYEMRISYALHPETGEPMVGFHELGEDMSTVIRLGMLEFAKHTLLEPYREEEYE